MKKIFGAIFAAALALCVSAVCALALEVGPYTANANTYYVNPDTGVTDDGGSKNVAVGEGMCRSVIGETALIEYDGSRTYLTVRTMLLSNIRNLKFAVQQTKGDASSYVEVSPEIMAEDAANDCADYRFEVPDSDSYVRCSAYVIPMSRDVTFYLNAAGNLYAGSGDFVVSVQPRTQEQNDVTVNSDNSISVSSGESGAKDNSAAVSSAAASSGSAATTAQQPAANNTAASGTATAAGSAANTATNAAANAAADAQNAPAASAAAVLESSAPSPEASAAAESEKPDKASAKPKATVNPKKTSDDDEEDEKSGTGKIVAIVLIIAIVLIAGAAAFYIFVWKKLKKAKDLAKSNVEPEEVEYIAQPDNSVQVDDLMQSEDVNKSEDTAQPVTFSESDVEK